MTIGPKKKISKFHTHTRHSTWQTLNIKRIAKKYQTVKCKTCGKYKLSHRVCPYCGYYGDKQIVTIKSKSKETTIQA